MDGRTDVRHPTTPWRVLVVALAALLWVVLAGAAPASAHASLVSTTPEDGAELTEPPEQVTLEFDEPVEVPAGGVRVYDGSGERVDTGDATVGPDPETVTASLEPELANGTYVVTYRIVSADGHPLRGATLFTVGGVRADTSLLAEVFAADADRGAALAAVVLRWLTYAGTLLAAGGVVAASALWRGLGARRGVVARLLARVAVVTAVLTLLGVVAQAALVTGGGPGVLADVPALAGVLAGGYGISAVVRLVGLAGVWGLARGMASDRAPGTAVGALAGGLAALSFALEGHTLTTEPTWLVVGADLVHLAAAAVWTGGLLVVAVAVGRGGVDRAPLRAGRLVARFSALATISIIALMVAGGALAWAEVRALRALVDTTYGLTLVAKLVLFVPVVAAAAYNNRRLVPALRALRVPVPAGGSADADRRLHAGGPQDGTASGGEDAHARLVVRLRGTLRLELAGIAAVLAATALLVGLQPAAEAAGVTGAYSTYVPLDDGYELNLTVDPNRAGDNEIHLYVLRPDGRQADLDEAVELSLALPERDIGPLERTTTRLGPGHFFLGGPELSVPGRWQLTADVPLDTFATSTATVDVVVNP